jgi:hypothetical protein
MKMNTHSTFPYHLSWTSQDIADAVPLRLFELVNFEAGDDAAGNAATSAPARREWRHRDYLRSSALPAFVRVHG